MKKTVKFSAILLAVNIFMSALPSAYASDALILSDPVYTVGAVETDAPQPGFVTTAVTVTNPGNEDTDVCLVVSVTDNTTGKLVSADVDVKTVPKNGSIELSKGIEVAENQTHHYYVWDNVLNHTPLRNTHPTDVKNVIGTAKTNSADISWDDALDDKGIKSYVLKVNGNEVARSDSTSYSILGLDRNSSYSCEIYACDEEGLLSKNPASFDLETYGMEECILAENNNANFSFIENHTGKTMDSYTESDFIAGRDCFNNTSIDKPDGTGKKVCFFYFPVSPHYINQEVRNVAFEVTYYDDSGSGSPSVQYNSEDGNSGKTCNLDAKTNTKTWKTVHAEVSDAKFINPDALTNSSFRISVPSGTKIYKVALCPGDFYSPDAPNVKFGDNTTDTYDMLFYPDDAASAYGMLYTTINGTACMCAPTGKKFEFDIKDDCATRTGGYIEVTYFDDGDDVLVLNYNNADNLKGEIPFTDTRQFRTVQIPLDAAVFSNGISGAAGKKFDFTLATQYGNPLLITDVRYVPGDSDYVIPPVTEMYAEVSDDGTSLDGRLEISIWNGSYDRDIGYSGKDGKAVQDGKHYLYNREFAGYTQAGQAWKRWKNAFYFKVPDSFVYGNDYGKVEVEVEYYATSGNIELLMKNASNSDKSAGKVAVTANTWTTKVFTVDSSDGNGIVFNNGFDGGCDFRINFDCQAYVHKVTVRKVTE